MLTLMKGDKTVKLSKILANSYLFIYFWHLNINIHHLCFCYIKSRNSLCQKFYLLSYRFRSKHKCKII